MGVRVRVDGERGTIQKRLYCNETYIGVIELGRSLHEIHNGLYSDEVRARTLVFGFHWSPLDVWLQRRGGGGRGNRHERQRRQWRSGHGRRLGKRFIFDGKRGAAVYRIHGSRERWELWGRRN
jgi:hypothetical protein